MTTDMRYWTNEQIATFYANIVKKHINKGDKIRPDSKDFLYDRIMELFPDRGIIICMMLSNLLSEIPELNQ